MKERVEVYVLVDGAQWVCQEEKIRDGVFRCAKCHRGVVAERFPGLFYERERCRVCGAEVIAVRYSYPAPGPVLLSRVPEFGW